MFRSDDKNVKDLRPRPCAAEPHGWSCRDGGWPFSRLVGEIWIGEGGKSHEFVAVESAQILQKTARFEVLDSLRGISAFMVIFFHIRTDNPLLQHSFISGGYLFVDFFFVLSGFVIARNYADRIYDGISFGSFLIRRFFRLLPLHLFVLGVYLVFELAQVIHHGTAFGEISGRTFEDFLKTLFLTNSFGMERDTIWNPPSWSISAEWWTYIIFGLLVLLLRGGWALRAGLLLLSVLGIAVVAATSDYMGQAVSDYGIFRCFYSFGLGAILAGFWPPIAARLEKVSDLRLGIAEILMVLTVFFFVSTYRQTQISFAAPFVFLMTVIVFTQERGLVSRLLLTPFFIRAGLLSYSIYMMHQLVIGRVRNLTDFGSRMLEADISTVLPFYEFVRIAIILVGVWIASGLTYRFVELPGQALGARVAKSWLRRKGIV